MIERHRRDEVTGGPPGAGGRRRLSHAGLALCLAVSWSCGDLVTQGRSPAFLMVDLLTARPGGDESAPFSTGLDSDVLTRGAVFSDPGHVIARLGLKDPGTPTSPTEPTSANFITVTRYRVEFTRADGRNTPGVDVPYPFDGGMTFTVGSDETAEGTFTLVRAQAKLEPPLMALRSNPVAISTIAQVTLYGHDQTGAAVSATGQIDVHFANWADPE